MFMAKRPAAMPAMMSPDKEGELHAAFEALGIITR
jgi:hypothetical protein